MKRIIGNEATRKIILLTAFCLCFVLFLIMAGKLTMADNTNTVNTRTDSSSFQIRHPAARQILKADTPAGVMLECRIPVNETIPNNSWLMFYTYHQYVDIYIDQECVFSLHPSDNYKFSKTVGSSWVKVPIYEQDKGKEIIIRLTPVYDFLKEQVPRFLIGSELAIYNYQYKATMLRVLLSGLLVLIGIIAIVPAIILKNGGAISLGLSSVMIGAWRLLDSSYAAFFVGERSLLIYYLAMFMLMGAAVPIANAVKNRQDPKNSLMFEIYSLIVSVVLILQLVAQLLGLIDMRQTLWMTHLLQLTGVILILMSLLFPGKGERKKQWLHNRRIAFFALAVAAFPDLGIFYLTGNTDDLVFTALACLIIVLVYSVRLLRNHLDQERQLKDRENQLIQSRTVVALGQIRSHFIFNVLNAISGMCKYDPVKADETIVRFSRYLRTNINILQNDELVTFRQELEHLEDYIALEQVRFGDRIRYEKNIDEEDFLLPSLVLQPLVENAIKYGLNVKEEGGTIRIATWAEHNRICITVTDDGVGFDLENLKKETSVGIRNVRFRLKHTVNAELTIDSTPGTGTCVLITIPREDG